MVQRDGGPLPVFRVSPYATAAARISFLLAKLDSASPQLHHRHLASCPEAPLTTSVREMPVKTYSPMQPGSAGGWIKTQRARERHPALSGSRRANKGRRARGAPPSGGSSRGGRGAAFRAASAARERPRHPAAQTCVWRCALSLWPSRTVPILTSLSSSQKRSRSQAHIFSSVRQRSIYDILKQLKKYSVQSSEGGNRETGDKGDAAIAVDLPVIPSSTGTRAMEQRLGEYCAWSCSAPWKDLQ
ncbi:uncharacterized protein [Callorhinus ursinus]|uniref:uncharacterized protein n=1 Tax=Callorhinus ursinus TaxID=34884 RepID=UPI003CD03A9C